MEKQREPGYTCHISVTIMHHFVIWTGWFAYKGSITTWLYVFIDVND